MHNFLDELKKKGPGGIPVGVWATIVAVGLYLGYRWYENRSGNSSNTSTDTTATDPNAYNYYPDAGGDSPGAIDGTSSPSVDTAPVTSPDVAPPATDTTDTLLERAGDQPSAIPTTKTGEKKKTRKRKHATTPHDEKQGNAHTKHRKISRGKRGSAPPLLKRLDSNRKRNSVIRNVSRSNAGPLRSSGNTGSLPVRHTAIKHHPAPLPRDKSERRIEAKAPPRGSRRLGRQ